MKLIIELEGGLPVYRQIEERVRSLVAAGQLQPGDRLPAIRELAAILGVNHNTVARAYLDLAREGVISTRRGRRTVVAGTPDGKQMAGRRKEKLREIVVSALDEARMLGYAGDEVAALFEEGLARWREENGG